MNQVNLSWKHIPKGVRVTVENMDIIAVFVRGDVKGVKLPPEERVIHFWNKHMDEEQTAEIGNWVINLGNDDIRVFTNAAKENLFGK